MKRLSQGKQRLERKVYRKEEPQLLSVHSPAVRHRDSTRRSANKRDPPVLQRPDKWISATSSDNSNPSSDQERNNETVLPRDAAARTAGCCRCRHCCCRACGKSLSLTPALTFALFCCHRDLNDPSFVVSTDAAAAEADGSRSSSRRRWWPRQASQEGELEEPSSLAAVVAAQPGNRCSRFTLASAFPVLDVLHCFRLIIAFRSCLDVCSCCCCFCLRRRCCCCCSRGDREMFRVSNS